MSRLILHIGLEKTGTTSFQAFCAENRLRLAERGVVYPCNPACFLDINHAPLAASYFTAADAARLLIAGRHADRTQAVAALKAEIAGAEIALVSAEHFSSRFDPGRIAALEADLTGLETTVAVVVRHPLSRALSAYATTVASGRDITLVAFVDELCLPANPYLCCRATLEAWSNVFGSARMLVVAYRDGEDIVEALCARLFRGVPADAHVFRLNVSPSAAEIERRRRANARGPAGRLAERVARRLAGRDQAGERPRLSEDQSRRLMAAVADDLGWLRDAYGVDFS